MKVLDSLEALIQSVEAAGKPLPSHWMQMELMKARNAVEGELPEEVRCGSAAEILAWSLAIEASSLEPLRAYFGPFAFGMTPAGTMGYAPDLGGLNPDTHAHWMERAAAMKHPALRARYLDLLWELTPHMLKQRSDYRNGLAASDAYIESISGGLTPEFHQQVIAACRAFGIALQLGDKGRAEAAKTVLFELHDKAVGGEAFWWKTYDRLIQERSTTDEERERLAKSLEGLLVGYLDQSSPETYNPFHAASVTERLQAYYRRTGNRADVVRLHESLGRTFEHAASLGNWMQASSQLQSAENAYLDAGMKEDAKRARIRRAEAIEKSRDEMQEFRFEGSISQKEMKEFVDLVVVDDPRATCLRIASQFVSEVAQVEKHVKEAAEGSIAAIIPVVLLARDHQTAALGSIDEDLDGHVMHRAREDIQWNFPYLHTALHAALEKHDLRPQSIAGFASRTGLFEDQTFLIEGIAAWFVNDHLKAIHVLVPQIERALRKLTGDLGEATTRKHPTMDDREVAIGMGEIFGNAVVKEALSTDLILYFRVIYSDPRGLNLRNEVAHGLIERGMVNSVISDLLIHTLLVLGIWSDLARYRMANAKAVAKA